jgi:creatinine amidohydrolase
VDLITTATAQDERRRGARVAVLPVGSFEQHGDHLPLITDTVVACLIAQRLSTAYNLFLLPPITISCSHEHSTFAGSVSIRAQTLLAIIDDVARSLEQSGIRQMVLVNGHGGNYVLRNAVQQANVGERRMVFFPEHEDWAAARAAAGLVTSGADDMHAGELETSVLLHAHPELVGENYKAADWLASPRPHLLVVGMAGYTSSGVIGRPSLATPEKGKAILESLTASFADHLKQLS